MTDEHFTGAKSVSGQCVGGWVIHFPTVVCTSSPSTAAAYDAAVVDLAGGTGCSAASGPRMKQSVRRRCG
jgi:hypothetical protein